MDFEFIVLLICLIVLSFNISKSNIEYYDAVVDWSNINPNAMNEALSQINRMVDFPELVNNVKRNGWKKQVDWAYVAYNNPGLQYSPVVAKIVINNRDDTLTAKQVAAISSKFNIPDPNKPKVININWSNSNPDTWDDVSSKISPDWWEILGRSWIRTYHFMRLVDWAKILYENPNNPNAQEIAKIILTNEDKSLTQEQISAIESKFNLKQKSSTSSTAAADAVLNWDNSDKNATKQALKWVNTFYNRESSDNIFVDGWVKQVDWANAIYNNDVVGRGIAEIVIKNRDGTLTDQQIKAISSKFNIPIPQKPVVDKTVADKAAADKAAIDKAAADKAGEFISLFIPSNKYSKSAYDAALNKYIIVSEKYGSIRASTNDIKRLANGYMEVDKFKTVLINSIKKQ